MNYTLEGRTISDDTGTIQPAPCIFCGEPLTHVNDGGEGWILGAVVDGHARHYFYHNDERCMTREQSIEIWRCGCEADYVESVGATCWSCGRSRAENLPTVFPADCKLWAGQGGHLTRKRPDGRCEDCGEF